MTPEQENAFYADPRNQAPRGAPVRRRQGTTAELSDPAPARLFEDLLQQVRERAAADDCSLSSWTRRAVEHEPTRHGG